jgi:hypothetical protein
MGDINRAGRSDASLHMKSRQTSQIISNLNRLQTARLLPLPWGAGQGAENHPTGCRDRPKLAIFETLWHDSAINICGATALFELRAKLTPNARVKSKRRIPGIPADLEETLPISIQMMCQTRKRN